MIRENQAVDVKLGILGKIGSDEKRQSKLAGIASKAGFL